MLQYFVARCRSVHISDLVKEKKERGFAKYRPELRQDFAFRFMYADLSYGDPKLNKENEKYLKNTRNKSNIDELRNLATTTLISAIDWQTLYDIDTQNWRFKLDVLKKLADREGEANAARARELKTHLVFMKLQFWSQMTPDEYQKLFHEFQTIKANYGETPEFKRGRQLYAKNIMNEFGPKNEFLASIIEAAKRNKGDSKDKEIVQFITKAAGIELVLGLKSLPEWEPQFIQQRFEVCKFVEELANIEYPMEYRRDLCAIDEQYKCGYIY